MKNIPDYAQSLSGLALLYTAMGEHDLAESFMVRAREIYKQVLRRRAPVLLGEPRKSSLRVQFDG